LKNGSFFWFFFAKKNSAGRGGRSRANEIKRFFLKKEAKTFIRRAG